MEKLAAKHRSGEISEELFTVICRFVRDGYVVLPGAVPGSIVDALNDDVQALWAAPPTGLMMETFEPDGQYHYIPADIKYREGRTRLLDIYAFSSVAREAITVPKVMEFLRAIFESQPKAFQGLHFWRGSQQAMHKDTAYVRVHTHPMHMVATWTALQDVESGIGELEYHVDSHRAPDFLFGEHKWMGTHHWQHDEFLESLHQDAVHYGHKRASFLAKQGDVLLWHADLAHGGAQLRLADRTRWSQVTHILPAPPMNRFTGGIRNIKRWSTMVAFSCRSIRTSAEGRPRLCQS